MKVLRTCNADGISDSDGGGLKGLAEGKGNWEFLIWKEDAIWQVIEVDPDLIVNLFHRVKFPRGEVIYSGNMEGAFKTLAGVLLCP